ncbi:MAG: PEP-CTERM sorting domain-containing protein [Phycisphaerae bacterium]
MRMLGFVAPALALLVLSASAQAAFTPWDALPADSWIYAGTSQTRIKLYTANAGAYDVGFDVAQANHSARGENALKFSLSGSTNGHLVSSQLAGSFGVANVGGTRTFSDLVILVAIDAPSLPGDFAMSLALHGTTAYNFSAADFAYYTQGANATGRPSGYYSVTSPSSEGVAYSFSSGMVTLFAAQGANLAPASTVTFDYSFTDLPGTAVFSVYGLDPSVGWIYHTNRSVIDANNPSSPVSTFEVVPEPAAALLAGFGLLAALWKRRKA